MGCSHGKLLHAAAPAGKPARSGLDKPALRLQRGHAAVGCRGAGGRGAAGLQRLGPHRRQGLRFSARGELVGAAGALQLHLRGLGPRAHHAGAQGRQLGQRELRFHRVAGAAAELPAALGLLQRGAADPQRIGFQRALCGDARPAATDVRVSFQGACECGFAARRQEQRECRSETRQRGRVERQLPAVALAAAACGHDALRTQAVAGGVELQRGPGAAAVACHIRLAADRHPRQQAGCEHRAGLAAHGGQPLGRSGRGGERGERGGRRGVGGQCQVGFERGVEPRRRLAPRRVVAPGPPHGRVELGERALGLDEPRRLPCCTTRRARGQPAEFGARRTGGGVALAQLDALGLQAGVQPQPHRLRGGGAGLRGRGGAGLRGRGRRALRRGGRHTAVEFGPQLHHARVRRREVAARPAQRAGQLHRRRARVELRGLQRCDGGCERPAPAAPFTVALHAAGRSLRVAEFGEQARERDVGRTVGKCCEFQLRAAQRQPAFVPAAGCLVADVER